MIVACFGILFYPVIMVFSLVCLGILELTNLAKAGVGSYLKEEKAFIVKFVLCLIFIFAVTIPYKLGSDENLGGLYSFEDTLDNPHFKEGGRLGQTTPLAFASDELVSSLRVAEGRAVYSPGKVKYYPEEMLGKKLIEWREKHSSTKIFLRVLSIRIQNSLIGIKKWNISRGNPIGFALYIILPLLLFLFGLFKLPKNIYIYIAGALVSCCIAQVVAFALYNPGRYIAPPLPVLISQIFPIGIGYALRSIPGAVKKKKHYLMLVLFALIFLTKIAYVGPAITMNYALNTTIPTDQKEMYNYIEKEVPKDKVLAGVLKDVNTIPLFARRRVLLNYENSGLCWWKRMNEEVILPRTKAICKAYFASSSQAIKQLRDEFGVDYIVVKKEYFQGTTYPDGYMFAPYNELGKKMFDANKGSFFFADPSQNIIAYQDDGYYLIDLGKLN